MNGSGRRIACAGGVLAAAIVGGGLIVDGLWRSSATYDEVAYLEIAAHWWRTGDAERITRMGSPLLFWKIQQAPALWVIDRAGFGHWIDDPIEHQAELLPWVRLSSAWLWLAALGLTVAWAAAEHGGVAAALAAWIFALSPNLIAHGSLATMEMPLIAGTATALGLFSRFLRKGDRRAFWGAAMACGVAFSCKFTAVLLPVLLAGARWVERVVGALARRRWAGSQTPHPSPLPVRGERVKRTILGARGMMRFVAVMAVADFVVTGGALLAPSERIGAHPSLEGAGHFRGVMSRLLETPLPQDWVGFARQLQHQRGGGPGYLLGERRMGGWWYYYVVCLAVKVPLSVWLLVGGRWVLLKRAPTTVGDRLALVVIAGTLAIVAIGSSRNYGFRYVLFLAPAAIVWMSGLARAGAWGRWIAVLGMLGQGIAVASIHPHELSYFPLAVGGPEGGRSILADSNLDWGQGARALARLQQERPEFRDLTFYAFGDTDPAHYGVVGTTYLIDAHGARQALPDRVSAATRFLAVSRSLQHGPWGPAGYFRELDGLRPAAIVEDHTIAVYRTVDLGTLRDRAVTGHMGVRPTPHPGPPPQGGREEEPSPRR